MLKQPSLQAAAPGSAIPADAAILSSCLGPASFWSPRHIVTSAWLEHAPFAFWLVSAMRPDTIVELGTHNGFSFLSFCQAVQQLELPTACYAVDTWVGDEHAGFYGEEVFHELSATNERYYAAFARLLRSTFDDSLRYFADGSVDLLHIDGAHGYEAVRHDYETWLPKLSSRGVVLFHDTNVKERDFGVFRFWAELAEQYPSFEFLHGNGLGVLGVGRTLPPAIRVLLESDMTSRQLVRAAYASLGAAVTSRYLTDSTRRQAAQLEAAVRAATQERDAAAARAATLEADHAASKAERDALSAHRDEARSAAATMLQEKERLSLELAAVQDAARIAQEERARLSGELAALQSAATTTQHDKERLSRELAALQGAVTTALQANGRLSQEFADLHHAHDTAREDLRQQHRAAHEATHRLQLIEGSTAWRVTYPLRARLTKFPGLRRFARRSLKLAWWTATFRLPAKLRLRAEQGGAADVAIGTAGLPPPADQGRRQEQAYDAAHLAGLRGQGAARVVFISGEADTPGHVYRVQRAVEAARSAGAQAFDMRIEQVEEHLHTIRSADLVVLWRAAWDQNVDAVVRAARDGGSRLIFDIDDLMFEPDVAKIEIIDGIRSMGLSEGPVRRLYERVQATLAHADYCIAPTGSLARRLRLCGKPTFMLPNGFDEGVLNASRLAVRHRALRPGDDLVRIGYATGTRTHQKDFAQAAEAVADVLRERPQCRLVLFQHMGDPVMRLAEFPAFSGLEEQIEWREMVSLAQLPWELARFDINLAPLEVDNPFCEAKSELKYFEAALVGVPTIASPTEPYRLAIRDGDTGCLARTRDEWHGALVRLVDDPSARAAMARAAFDDVLGKFGPEARAEAIGSIIEQIRFAGRRAARAFELDLARAARPLRPRPHVPRHTTLFETDQLRLAEVTVVVPLYNYARFVVEALESVRDQTLAEIDLIVVDDASTDDSQAIARAWLTANHERFNRAMLIQNTPNAGLAFTRNVGFSLAETAYVLPLDADNRLMPRCAEQCLAAIKRSGASYAYPQLQHFGDSRDRIGLDPYEPVRFVPGNYIDAMALVRKSAWVSVGGYERQVKSGWEDFDFWCKLVEQGGFGEHVPEVLAGYRVHAHSMLHYETNVPDNKLQLIEQMHERHPWLRLR